MSNQVKIYSIYDKPHSDGVSFEDTESMTQQHFLDDANINTIMARYEQTGTFYEDSSGVRRTPLFGDFTDVSTYQDALNLVIESEELFDNLPASLRRQFEDDPAQFLAFVENEDNYDECIKLGIFQPDPAEPEVPLGEPPASEGEQA